MLQPWLVPPFFQLTAKYRSLKEHLEGAYVVVDILTNELEAEFLEHGTAKLRNDPQRPVNYLTQLYKIRDTMTRQELRNEIITMLFAGVETSGKTISAVLLCLAMYPEIQDKVLTELNEVISSDDDVVDEERLEKLVYLERVIKETLRLFPVNPIFGRKTTAKVELSINENHRKKLFLKPKIFQQTSIFHPAPM